MRICDMLLAGLFLLFYMHVVPLILVIDSIPKRITVMLDLLFYSSP